MWKRSMIVVGGAVLAVSLPTAAFAMIAETGGTARNADAPAAVQATHQAMYENGMAVRVQAQVQDPVQANYQSTDEMAVAIQAPVQEPILEKVMAQDQVMDQERLRLHVETGPPDGTDPTQTRLRQHQQMATGNPDAPMGDQDARRGNPDAPMLGDGTGECLHDGEPVGSGPHGQGGQNDG